MKERKEIGNIITTPAFLRALAKVFTFSLNSLKVILDLEWVTGESWIMATWSPRPDLNK